MIRIRMSAQRSPQRFAAAAKAQRHLPPINHRIAAFAAAGLLSIGALAAVQVFGDPNAAGPRQVLSLQPTDAAADAAAVRLDEIEAFVYHQANRRILAGIAGIERLVGAAPARARENAPIARSPGASATPPRPRSGETYCAP